VLVSSDPAFLQRVFIKQFSNFHARKMWPVQVDPDKSDDVHLFFARGQRWKRLRSVINPYFTANKLRKVRVNYYTDEDIVCGINCTSNSVK
jgi:cytochrome P450